MLTAKAGMSHLCRRRAHAAGGLRKYAIFGAILVQFLAAIDAVAPASPPLGQLIGSCCLPPRWLRDGGGGKQSECFGGDGACWTGARHAEDELLISGALGERPTLWWLRTFSRMEPA